MSDHDGINGSHFFVHFSGCKNITSPYYFLCIAIDLLCLRSIFLLLISIRSTTVIYSFHSCYLFVPQLLPIRSTTVGRINVSQKRKRHLLY